MTKLGKPSNRHKSRHPSHREITNIRGGSFAKDNRGCAVLLLGGVGMVAAGIAAIKGWA